MNRGAKFEIINCGKAGKIDFELLLVNALGFESIVVLDIVEKY